MSNSRKSRSVCASSQGKRLLKQAKGEWKDSEGNRLTYERIAEMTKLSNKTVSRFFSGKGIDEENVYPIIQVLDLKYEDVISLEEDKVGETMNKIEEHDSDSNSASELIINLKTTLEEYRKNIENNYQAMDWLKGNRQALAHQAAEVALKECDNQNLHDGDIEYARILEELSKDIKECLRICYICLEKGTIRVLEEARQKSLIPSKLDYELYEKALLFIKQQKVAHELPQEVGQSLAACLQYLITIVSLI
jgi:transcriptional regulator with XRE-family HTH domain